MSHEITRYDYALVRDFTDQITESIGIERLYTDSNLLYPDALYNYSLSDYKVLIEFLQEELQQRGTPKTIHFLFVSSLSHLQGLYANLNENIYIVVNDKLDVRWQQFTIVKEICSAYVDHYQDEILKNTIYEDSDFLGSIEDAYKNIVAGTIQDGLKEGDLDSERFSVLLATELMIPQTYRYLTNNYLTQVDDQELTLNEVAKSLVIPELILKLYMSNYNFNN